MHARYIAHEGLNRSSCVSEVLRCLGLQLLWFACLHLPRAAWWAIKGRPRPPQLHASPTLARLRACKNAEQAKQFSMQAGFDGDGPHTLIFPCLHPIDHL